MFFSHRAAMSAAAFALFSVLATVPVQAQTGTIIANTFGPNESFIPSGIFISGANNAYNTGYQGIADAFTPSGNFTLNEVDAAFNYAGGAVNSTNNDSFSFSLQSSNAFGLPSGVSLEQYSIYVLQGPGGTQVTKLTSTAHPLLSAGQTYWLVASPLTSQTAVTWNYPTAANPSGPSAVDHGSGFVASTGQAAFRIYASPAAVPEASTLASLGLLLTLGLGSFAAARKRVQRTA